MTVSPAAAVGASPHRLVHMSPVVRCALTAEADDTWCLPPLCADRSCGRHETARVHGVQGDMTLMSETKGWGREGLGGSGGVGCRRAGGRSQQPELLGRISTDTEA